MWLYAPLYVQSYCCHSITSKHFCPVTQEEALQSILQRHTLSRMRSQVSSFAAPHSEVILPVAMTHSQREAYKTQLARAYEVLTEARTPRQTAHRAGQLRAVCTALRQVPLHVMTTIM